MLLVGTLLALIALVTAIPSPEISRNSERLARRLPPLPPLKFRRNLPGQAREEPTPAYAAKRSYPSATPVTYTGRIQIRYNETALGYLANSNKAIGGINNEKQHHHGNDLHVSFTTTSTGNGPFLIRALHPKWKGSDYLGAASSKHSPTLSDDSAETLNFVAIEKTPKHSPPVPVTGGHGESYMWSVRPRTKELRPHWINPNKTQPQTSIAYDAHDNKLFFVGDLTEYNRKSTHRAVHVKFYLVSDS